MPGFGGRPVASVLVGLLVVGPAGCSGDTDADGWRDPYCGLVEELDVARVEALKVNAEDDPSTIAAAIRPVVPVREIVTGIVATAPESSRQWWATAETELLKLEQAQPGIADRAAKDAGGDDDLFGSGAQADADYIHVHTWAAVGFLPVVAAGMKNDLVDQVQKDCDIKLEILHPPE